MAQNGTIQMSITATAIVSVVSMHLFIYLVLTKVSYCYDVYRQVGRDSTNHRGRRKKQSTDSLGKVELGRAGDQF